jgi:glycosyltransferase involved in cell wall biosynthesis
LTPPFRSGHTVVEIFNKERNETVATVNFSVPDDVAEHRRGEKSPDDDANGQNPCGSPAGHKEPLMADRVQAVVLLATYNGAPYLAAQMESLVAQKLGFPFDILVSDDASEDATLTVLAGYAAGCGRLEVLPIAEGRQGVVGNFSRLMQAALERGYGYAYLSDQDDVWVEDKMALTMDCMQEMERRHGRSVPLLVHSDLIIASRELDVISPSFMRYMKLRNEAKDPLGVLLTQNYVTGCTILANRALLGLALPVPQEVRMHDWWLAQIAAVAGKLGYVGVPTVLYRQHEQNVVGVKRLVAQVTKDLFPFSEDRHAQMKELARRQAYTSVQAGLLYGRLLKRRVPVPEQEMQRIANYARIWTWGWMERVRVALVMGYRRQGLLRNLMYYYTLVSPWFGRYVRATR